MRYDKLHQLLKQGDWRQAEYETARLTADFIAGESKLSCTDLLFEIDEPWVRYSNEKFGFSVQFKIYYDCGVNLNKQYLHHWADRDDKLEKFFDRVGWLRNGNAVMYENLIFDLSAPAGHLPASFYWDDIAYGKEGDLIRCFFSSFWQCVGQTVRKQNKDWGHLETLKQL